MSVWASLDVYTLVFFLRRELELRKTRDPALLQSFLKDASLLETPFAPDDNRCLLVHNLMYPLLQAPASRLSADVPVGSCVTH